MKRRIRIATLIGLATCLAVLASPGAVAKKSVLASCSNSDRVVDHGGGWNTIKMPEWTTTPTRGGPARITAPQIRSYAVDSYDPNRLFVANAHQIMRSQDGGCSWKEVFSFPTAPGPDTPSGEASYVQLDGLRVTSSSSGIRSVFVIYKLVYSHTLDRDNKLLASFDDGSTWSAPTGLPPAGSVLDVRIAPSDPKIVYAVVAEPTQVPTGVASLPMAATSMYASSDGGRSWQLASAIPIPPGEYLSITVDPIDPRKVWASDLRSLSYSDDAAETWSPIPTPEVPERIIQSNLVIAYPSSKSMRLFIAVSPSGEGDYLAMSEDNGNSWSRIVIPDSGTTGNIAVAGRRGEVIVPTATSVSGAYLGDQLFRLDSRSLDRPRPAWVNLTAPYVPDCNGQDPGIPCSAQFKHPQVAQVGRETVLYFLRGGSEVGTMLDRLATSL